MGDLSSSRYFSPLRGSRMRENVDKTPPKLFLLTGLAILGGFLFGYDTGLCKAMINIYLIIQSFILN